jgi:flagellar motor protein MotB
MIRSAVLVLAATAVAFGSGCAHGAAYASKTLAEMEQVRLSPGAREGERLAPQEYGRAEQDARLARAAVTEGDNASATLYAEQAIARYQHALVLARLERATVDLAEGSAALANADEQARSLALSRMDVEHEADELDKRLKIAREALAPVPSGPADPAREAARLVAARALTTQGRLLCGAARLLSLSAPGLAEAEKAVQTLENQLAGTPKTTPIDAAARARAACLDVLTHARRAQEGSHAGEADALLAELSAAGGWEPSRDERGVVVTLRDAFNGVTLLPDADKKLQELGRVAAAHVTFAVQVVVHDATPPNAHETASDAQRADAAVAAILSGGAPAARVKAETAGARAPVVDPSDARHRGRNARLEVVFVNEGS